jgi:hypothetical protein
VVWGHYVGKKITKKTRNKEEKNPKGNLVPKNAMILDNCKSNVMQDNYKSTNLCN